MRACLQRVSRASVTVAGSVVGEIGPGLLILLGAGPQDTDTVADGLCEKCLNLRIFPDEEGKMNRSLQDMNGEALVISQFTLYADVRRGNRPGFSDAAPPDKAERLYDYFCSCVQKKLGRLQTGRFGAAMQVELVNNGPVTIWLDTEA